MIYPILCPTCNQLISNVSDNPHYLFKDLAPSITATISCPCDSTYVCLEPAYDEISAPNKFIDAPSYIHIPLSSIGADYDFQQYFYAASPTNKDNTMFFIINFIRPNPKNIYNNLSFSFDGLCPFEHYKNPSALKDYINILLTFI